CEFCPSVLSQERNGFLIPRRMTTSIRPTKPTYSTTTCHQPSRKWIAKLKPMSKHAFLEAASYEPRHDLTCMYLLCELDQDLPIVAQEMMAGMLGEYAMSFRRTASHSPFLSVPDKVADAVELGAQE